MKHLSAIQYVVLEYQEETCSVEVSEDAAVIRISVKEDARKLGYRIFLRISDNGTPVSTGHVDEFLVSLDNVSWHTHGVVQTNDRQLFG